ncbi:hypothetical protein I4U23_027385 [Adineta vaga]|nr:hypothetical protein I4U23_027385 [Adineta vaga]
MLNIIIIIILFIILNQTFAYRWRNSFAMRPAGPDAHWGYDCPGNDFFNFHTSETNNHTCYLKNGLFSDKNLNFINDRDTMCSKSFSKVIEDKELDKFNNTIEYKWDCQIPKCSLFAGILRSDNPVNVCLSDGYSLSEIRKFFKIGSLRMFMHDPSYMCSNQQPWFINDSLAYGYGLMEYDFHRGRPLVVLYAPGSSDYTVKCIDQWRNGNYQYEYSSDIKSREECFKLPQPIQNGCLFKYDWFKGIEKPNMIYTKTQCPKEIIDRSGCYQGVV